MHPCSDAFFGTVPTTKPSSLIGLQNSPSSNLSLSDCCQLLITAFVVSQGDFSPRASRTIHFVGRDEAWRSYQNRGFCTAPRLPRAQDCVARSDRPYQLP